ncbi:MAG: biopolymer transporter ExbD [Myxococcales bacterium]|nr:biopolymer transporter ExbD [Myxococcales bacterium]MCB9582275.1 biopolymer transporter ExbD [Polyangiaceae bacterium]
MIRAALSLFVVFTAGCSTTTPPPARCAEPTPAAAPATPTSTRESESTPPPVKAVPYDLPKTEDFAPPVALPTAGTAEAVSPVLSVELTRDGAVSVNGKPLSNVDDLRRIAQQAHDGNPDVRAVIRADKDVAWGSVVHVLDLLKQGSVAKIAFGVSR